MLPEGHPPKPLPRAAALARAALLLAAALIALGASCSASTPTPSPPSPQQVRAARDHARSRVHASLSRADEAAAIMTARSAFEAAVVRVNDDRPAFARRALLALAEGEAWASITPLLEDWTPPDDDLDAQRALIRWAIAQQAFEVARPLAWRAAERFEEARPELMRLWYQTHAADPAFLPPRPLDLVPGENIDALKLMVREGTSFMYKVKVDGETVAAFKVMQRLSLTNYRGEIAAYRLCPLIHCGFSVPLNVEARISREHFDAVHSGDRAWIQNRNRRGIHLIWFTDDDGVEWLHGTHKDWVPGFTQFPIEKTDTWEHILSLDTDLETLRAMPLAELLAPIKRRYANKYREILDRAEGVTSIEFARQLSNLHVFDLLTNNWDRYSMQPYPGLNCQWNHGQFVSIDNGATFQPDEVSERGGRMVAARLRLQRRVERFSRSTIDAIRWMDTEALFPILFPPSPHHDDEQARYDLFLERRAWLLEHVDGLIEEHGEAAVLALP